MKHLKGHTRAVRMKDRRVDRIVVVIRPARLLRDEQCRRLREMAIEQPVDLALRIQPGQHQRR